MTTGPRPNIDGAAAADAAASVDRALRVLQLLRDRGALRVTEAAQELGVSVSTAHRALSALVARDLAAQDERRRYIPGPGLTLAHPRGDAVARLLGSAAPRLRELAEATGESVNLMTRVGPSVRFLSTVTSRSASHVGGRRGVVSAAERTAGGRALLARLTRGELQDLYGGVPAYGVPRVLSPGEVDALHRDLEQVRSTGFGVNVELAERGVVAIGAALPAGEEGVELGVSVSLPATRAERLREPALLRALRRSVDALGEELSGT